MAIIKREKKPGHGAMIDFTDPDWGHSGITIEYVKSRDMFYIAGWYDSMGGIAGGAVSRSELFTMLDVPECK